MVYLLDESKKVFCLTICMLIWLKKTIKAQWLLSIGLIVTQPHFSHEVFLENRAKPLKASSTPALNSALNACTKEVNEYFKIHVEQFKKRFGMVAGMITKDARRYIEIISEDRDQIKIQLLRDASTIKIPRVQIHLVNPFYDNNFYKCRNAL